MLTAVEVKQMLVSYVNTEREIENQIERLEVLESRLYSIGSPEISDMPRNPSPSNDRISVMVHRKDELEAKIKKLIDSQSDKRKLYESCVERIVLPDQRAVIRMHYFDCEKWDSVNRMVFGGNEDFDDKRDSYMRRIMILHGQALQQLAEIMDSI